MKFDFDPRKSEANRRERGFGFAYAARVFLGDALISFSRSERDGRRMKAVGLIDGEIYAVVFVDSGEIRRIISARRASRKERREWLESE